MVKKTIDFRDSLSSISLLKVTQVLSRMSPSEILEIRGIDADIRQDLFKVLPQEEYEILDYKDNTYTDTLERIHLRKRS
jgi:TusA-related sulfurtransferase